VKDNGLAPVSVTWTTPAAFSRAPIPEEHGAARARALRLCLCRWFGRKTPTAGSRHPARAALSWRTRILAIKQTQAGRALGTGALRYPAASRIAALPVGYADGYNRDFPTWTRDCAWRLRSDRRAISMDLTLWT